MISERSGKKADKDSAQDCVDWCRRARQAWQDNQKKKEKSQ